MSVRSVNLGLSSKSFATRKLTNCCPKAHNINDTLTLSGYHFLFIQSLIPDTDALGHALKFYPQMKYKGHKPLHRFGLGPFCRFHITPLNLAGVYLLVSNDKILYIGQTRNLHQRFNNRCYGSYGFITPSACYQGGQSTNCKINHLVLHHFEIGQTLLLYFLQTTEHKRIERELLQLFHTPYNVKDN